MSQFIYIGQYFHYYGKDLQELGLTEKKIGKTIDLKKREYQLNRTKGTIGYTYVAAWDVKDMDAVEKILHVAFDDNRLSGEWFDDVQGDLVDRVREMMSLAKWGKEVDLGEDKDEQANKTRKDAQRLKFEYDGEIIDETTAKATLLKICEMVVKQAGYSEDELSKHYLFRKHPVLNTTTGVDYTTPVEGTTIRVYHSLSNEGKKKHIESLSKQFNLNIKTIQ